MAQQEPNGGPEVAPPVLVIDGRPVECQPGQTVLQALLVADPTRSDVVGCAGQGVCGACRALLRREADAAMETVLACEVAASPGMEVTFLDRQPPRLTHRYDLAALRGPSAVHDALVVAFPESQHCRHCHGCDAACPKGLEVEGAVASALAGDLDAAAAAFDLCVMCGLCTGACPEEIAPNHLGVYLRRATASTAQLPDDLFVRLREIADGGQPIAIGEGAG